MKTKVEKKFILNGKKIKEQKQNIKQRKKKC